MIHERNANILSILPSVASNLVTQISYTDLIYRFLDKQIENSNQNQTKLGRLLHVRKQIEQANLPESDYSVDIDSTKSILLACTFGELYTSALGLLTGKHISIQIWGKTPGMSSSETISEYFKNPCVDSSIFFQISKSPKIVREEIVLDVNPFLQLRSMVAKVGLDMNLTTFNIERFNDPPKVSHGIKKEDEEMAHSDQGKFTDLKSEARTKLTPTPSGSDKVQDFESEIQFFSYGKSDHVIVDPAIWFCSCKEFTDRSFVLHDMTAPDLLGTEVDSWTLTKLLKSSRCFHSSDMPLCQHLLSVLLMLCNWDVSVDAKLVSFRRMQSNDGLLEEQSNKLDTVDEHKHSIFQG